ncbi:MAG: hypothetical protein MJA27_04100 [Pseudanabaenales cyanobacterium]|nr:hypothetical protein [Pseudanabaenales cyanobacterium]
MASNGLLSDPPRFNRARLTDYKRLGSQYYKQPKRSALATLKRQLWDDVINWGNAK